MRPSSDCCGCARVRPAAPACLAELSECYDHSSDIRLLSIVPSLSPEMPRPLACHAFARRASDRGDLMGNRSRYQRTPGFSHRGSCSPLGGRGKASPLHILKGTFGTQQPYLLSCRAVRAAGRPGSDILVSHICCVQGYIRAEGAGYQCQIDSKAVQMLQKLAFECSAFRLVMCFAWDLRSLFGMLYI